MKDLDKKGELDAKSHKRRTAWKMALKWNSKNKKKYSQYFNEKIKQQRIR